MSVYNVCIVEFIKQFWEKENMRGIAEHLNRFSTTGLLNSIIQEHEWKILFII